MGTRISTIAKIICTHLKKILEIKKKNQEKIEEKIKNISRKKSLKNQEREKSGGKR